MVKALGSDITQSTSIQSSEMSTDQLNIGQRAVMSCKPSENLNLLREFQTPDGLPIELAKIKNVNGRSWPRSSLGGLTVAVLSNIGEEAA
ncbi:hypothetical protein V6N13_027755 [Hibiscus sabdariffa]|uniref:Uncharacterized protein n=1 Tax=Hibiscus sabdariffa TaxID=183260 RepID=A0ABR2CFI6_9ROSI